MRFVDNIRVSNGLTENDGRENDGPKIKTGCEIAEEKIQC